MNEVKHYTIVTTRGLEKIQAKYQASQTVNLTHMGFGGANEYIAPNAAATIVPNQWAKVPLERHPDDGFIGGGATVTNKEEYKGHWLGSVGIYDEDDELILIAATPLVEISLDESVVASYPIDLYTVLDNASSVIVITDTSMTYPTYDEMNDAINKLKELIFGGNPSAALDTLFELAAAYEGSEDAIKTILAELSNLKKGVESNSVGIQKIKKRAMAFLDATPEIRLGGEETFAYKVKFNSSLSHVRCIYFKVPVVDETGWEKDISFRIDVVSSGELLETTSIVDLYGKMVNHRYPLTMTASTKELILPFEIINKKTGQSLRPSTTSPMGMWSVSE